MKKKDIMMMHVALLDAGNSMKEVTAVGYRRVSVPYEKPWWWNRWWWMRKYIPNPVFKGFSWPVTVGGVGFCLSGDAGKNDMFGDHIFSFPKYIIPGDTLNVTFSEEFIKALKIAQKGKEVEYTKI